MNADERKNLIRTFRERIVEGRFVDLYPASEEYADQIMNLRNKPKNMHMFNQEELITLDGQRKWFASYRNAEDDLYWCVLSKDGRFLGTIRLYHIDFNGEFCEEGSYMIDEEYADEAPYAIETKIMVLDIAFNELNIETIINHNRADNKVMNNLDNQLGFDKGDLVRIRGTEYLHRVLTESAYKKNKVKFTTVIDYWSRR